MPRYVDAELAKAQFTGNFQDSYGPEEAKAMIDEVPTADVAPVRHAHWVDGHRVFYPVCYEGITIDKKMYFCSYCGRSITIIQGQDLYREYPFCNCDAKMDEEVKDDAVH